MDFTLPVIFTLPLDTFTQVAARELKPYGVAMVSVWPGPLVGTERVRRQGADVAAAITETPFLAGRALARALDEATVGLDQLHIGELLEIATVIVHDPDLALPGAGAGECDLAAVR